jgi:phage terminase large subunit GpA-like protein
VATAVDTQLGLKRKGPKKVVNLYRWSNPSFKDLLNNRLTGLTPGFSIPENIGKDWLAHMSAEQRVEVRARDGTLTNEWKKIRDDDHLRDVELMILAAMSIAAHFGQCPMPAGSVMRAA